jgi:hypothetical protein
MINVLDQFVEKTKTHIYVQTIVAEDRAVYEIMWKNMVEADRSQTTT